MAQQLTYASILCNALDSDYTSDLAVDDLSKPGNEPLTQ